MTEFTLHPNRDGLPELLQEKWQQQWQAYQHALLQYPLHEVTHPHFLASVVRVWSASEFVAHYCIQHPDVLHALFADATLLRDYTAHEISHHLGAALHEVSNTTQLDRALRQFRQREMVRIAWRDLAGWATLKQTLAELSALADACIQHSLIHITHWHTLTSGNPQTSNGATQSLYVIALGKLGGNELNFSSDIDIMLAYPEAGSTTQHSSNQVFFTGLAQQLIKTLNAPTADGFVFRVDLRLRPFGNAGPLVMDFVSLRDYYQEHGRDWERYALVKARIVNPDNTHAPSLSAILSAFTYRPYIDYSAIHALREMKKIILHEAEVKDLQRNIKRGPGGIREIEFSAQVLQLIRGGHEPLLQQRNLLKLLQIYTEHDYLPTRMCAALHAAYVFLRNTEHRLQQWQDKQTQLLPHDELAKQRLAFAMGFSDSARFYRQLERHRIRVITYFSALFETPKSQHFFGVLVATQAQLQLIWLNYLAPAQATTVLHEHGFNPPDTIRELLHTLRTDPQYQQLRRKEKERVDILIPLLLSEIIHHPEPAELLKKLSNVIVPIMNKASYLRLLLEHNTAREQLILLIDGSTWVTQQLANYPVLLEDLTDTRALYTPLDQPTLTAQLRQLLIGIPQDDLQQQMHALRRFKNTHVLRVAAADLMAVLPLMKVSDYLTFTASVLLREVQAIALQELLTVHGQPTDKHGTVVAADFCIIAYGKLGGIELSYGSDLDLVFVHAECDPNAQTNGDVPISNQVFYTRLAQSIIHLINTSTAEGHLYKVDMRLRPSGNSGLLVSSITAFAAYQDQDAWTWEHQALVRAQAISGSPALREQFTAIRQHTLAKSRPLQPLRDQVSAMRERLRVAAEKNHSPALFDVKHSLGGITDIEFLVQFGVLRWAQHYPSLLVYPDNIRILEAFADTQLLTHQQTTLLCDAYRCYRSIVHRAQLQGTPDVVPLEQLHGYPQAVRELWQSFLANPA